MNKTAYEYDKLGNFYVTVEHTITKRKDKEHIKNAWLLLDPDPDWIEIVIHRPIKSDKDQNRWIVSERTSGLILAAQCEGCGPLMTRNQAASIALYRIGLKGEEEIKKLIQDWIDYGKHAESDE